MNLYTQATPSFDTLGRDRVLRDRVLLASANFDDLLVVDANGGFTPDNENLFQIIDSLIREVNRLRDRA